MTIKVHGQYSSVCTSRVLTTLVEKEVTDWELVPVSLLTGEHKQPDFLALQPFGAVPVLVDGSLTLFESRAIIRFLAHKFESQGTSLYGYTPQDKAFVEQWLEVEGQNFSPPIGTILWERVYKVWGGGQTDKAVVDASIVKLKGVLDIYEAHLATSKYLAGEFFSLADLSNLPLLHKLVTIAKLWDLVGARPHVKAWFADISSRPAWKKTLELAALDSLP